MLDCAGDCGGSAVVDECGTCNGDGIADGACDCDGNVDLGCGCGEEGPTGCDETCGSTAVVDDCGECGGDGTSCQVATLSLGAFDASGSLEVLYDFGSDVAGFQFEVSGLDLAGGSGGAAGDAGFEVSTGGVTVLGFSFTGSTIPAGSGVLTVLSFTDVTAGSTEISLGFGSAVTSSDGSTFDTSASGSVNHGDPDCSGDYYGDLVVDVCGECGGEGIADG